MDDQIDYIEFNQFLLLTQYKKSQFLTLDEFQQFISLNIYNLVKYHRNLIVYICNIGQGPSEDFIPGTSEKILDEIIDYHVGVLIHQKKAINLQDGMVTNPLEYLKYIQDIYYQPVNYIWTNHKIMAQYMEDESLVELKDQFFWYSKSEFDQKIKHFRANSPQIQKNNASQYQENI